MSAICYGKIRESLLSSSYTLNDNINMYQIDTNMNFVYEIDTYEAITCKINRYKAWCDKLFILLAKSDEKKRRIKNFCLMDNRFMVKIFEDSECVKLLLRVIMQKTNLEIISINVEHVVDNLQGRSIRVDINAVDSEGIYYDIEVQRADAGAIPKRARYNSALLDANITNPGDKYQNLPETYVIFITENDVLGSDLPIYHIERTVQETGKSFDDKAHIIYVNSKIQDDTDLGRLMHDFYCKNAEDMFYKELADRIDYFKNDKKGVMSMYACMDEWAIRDRAEGMAEGEEKGRIKNLISLISRKLIKGKEVFTIAEELDEDIDKVAEICRIAEEFAPGYDTDKIYEAYKLTI